MGDPLSNQHDVLITGLGLISSLGEGADAHWARLGGAGGQTDPILDDTTFAPYPVHPMVELDLTKQIPRRGDQRQMEPWQRIGVYAAGLALDDAGIAGETELLDRTNLIVAAGSGERDTTMDMMLLEKVGDETNPDITANEVLRTELRPTLFLAQLSNLLAGNISIVHKVTGSSRTFMGEEMAGLSAVEIAHRRITSGQDDLFLVGGAFNAEREDMLLILELGRNLRRGGFKPVWERTGDGGGMVTGSVGAFLVLESRRHAEARSARVYARLADIVSGRCNRAPGAATASAKKLFDRLDGGLSPGPLAVLSGSCGTEPAAGEELAFLQGLDESRYQTSIRTYASVLGHSLEAHFPAGLTLAALALSNGAFYRPFDASGVETGGADAVERILVTGWGHWRGEGLGLIEVAD